MLLITLRNHRTKAGQKPVKTNTVARARDSIYFTDHNLATFQKMYNVYLLSSSSSSSPPEQCNPLLSETLQTLAPFIANIFPLSQVNVSHRPSKTVDLFESLADKRKRKNRELAELEDKRPVMTCTYKNNTDNNVFYYAFGVQCDVDFFGCRYIDSQRVLNTMKTGILWEEARYLIEKKHHCFDVRQKKANLQGSYIQGFFWKPNMKNWRRDATLVPRDHLMSHSDCLILVRKPLPPHILPYVPNSHKSEVEKEERQLMSEEERKREERINAIFEHMKTELKFTDDMTEEEKIDLIVKNTEDRESIELLRTRTLGKNKFFKIGGQFHPADIESDPSIVRPPPRGYVCHRCLSRGHWKHLCPTLMDINFVPQTVRKLPSGIPKTMLREAKTDDERRQAMVTDDGQLVVMKY